MHWGSLVISVFLVTALCVIETDLVTDKVNSALPNSFQQKSHKKAQFKCIEFQREYKTHFLHCFNLSLREYMRSIVDRKEYLHNLDYSRALHYNTQKEWKEQAFWRWLSGQQDHPYPMMKINLFNSQEDQGLGGVHQKSMTQMRKEI